MENRRFERSIKDHLRIIDALEERDADLAERLVLTQALDLSAHVEHNANAESGAAKRSARWAKRRHC